MKFIAFFVLFIFFEPCSAMLAQVCSLAFVRWRTCAIVWHKSAIRLAYTSDLRQQGVDAEHKTFCFYKTFCGARNPACCKCAVSGSKTVLSELCRFKFAHKLFYCSDKLLHLVHCANCNSCPLAVLFVNVCPLYVVAFK